MELKKFAVSELKALPETGTDAPGTFEAVVSVFGNVDSVGDVVEKGAFAKSLENGLPPIVWSHQWDVPPIGTTLSATETDAGLLIKGRLFVGEGEDSPMARAVYTAMKAQDGRGVSTLKEFSFGYSVTDSEEKTVDGTDIRVLKGIDLFECGPCLKGVNPATTLLAVKSALQPEAKAGRVLSKANEDRLREAARILDEVVAQVMTDEPPKALDTPTSVSTEDAADSTTAVAPDVTDAPPEVSQDDRARAVDVLTATSHSRP